MGASWFIKQAGKWFVKNAWPWIIANIWPAIQDMILEVFSLVIASLIGTIKEYIEIRTKRNQENAKNKAAWAEEQAARADTPEEAARMKAVANDWKEEMDKLHQENEELKLVLEGLRVKAEKDFSTGITQMPLNDLLDIDNKQNLTLKGSPEKLPELPSPGEPEE